MSRYTCEPVTDDFVDTAPVRFVNSVVIEATPAAIWVALEDASAWPRWASPIKHVEWTSAPPLGVGTTRTVRMIAKMVVDEEFITWERFRRMTFRFNATSMNGVSAFAERYSIEVISPAQTRVTWIMAMAPKGVSKLIVPLGRWPMRMAFGRMLGVFKKLVENEYAKAGVAGA